MTDRAHFGIPVPMGPLAVGAGMVFAILIWSYWPALADMQRTWAKDPRYSHGYLVAPFALYLLWSRRQVMPEVLEPSLLGVVVVALGGVLRSSGAVLLSAVDRRSLSHPVARRSFFARWRAGLSAVGVAIDRISDLHGAASIPI